MNDDDQYEPATIKELFEAAQHIGGVLTALEASGAPVMTPYSGFSVFVAAHINMYGTIAPLRYPGGLERAEEQKARNLTYLENLSKIWPVGRNWVRCRFIFLISTGKLMMSNSGGRYKMRIAFMKR